jgi:hypothetical protein
LLRSGVKAPQVGDRFHVSTDVADTTQEWNVGRTR